MTIKFLSKIEKWKDFSNLASYPIQLDGEVWASSEHYYQFKKFEKTEPELAEKIKNSKTPKEAKVLSMENKNVPKDWDERKVEILQKAVRKKFETHENLKELLLSTGEEELVEANPDDYFWGEGEDGTGENMMGKILMKVRSELG